MGVKRGKKIAKSGGITIPSDIRVRFGYTPDTYVSMEVNEDGSILLRPNKRVCFYCEGDAHTEYKGTAICLDCIEKLATMIPDKAGNKPKISRKKKAVTKSDK